MQGPIQLSVAVAVEPVSVLLPDDTGIGFTPAPTPWCPGFSAWSCCSSTTQSDTEKSMTPVADAAGVMLSVTSP